MIGRYFRRLFFRPKDLEGHEARQSTWSLLDVHDVRIIPVLARAVRLAVPGNLSVIGVGVCAMLFGAITVGLLPLLFRTLVDVLGENYSNIGPPLVHLDAGAAFLGIEDRRIGLLTVLIAILGLLIVIRSVMDVIGNLSFSFLSRSLIERLQGRLFKHLLTLDLGWLSQVPSGRLATLMLSDMESMGSATNTLFTGLPSILLRIAALLAAMLYIDWRLTLIAAIFLPMGGIVQHLMSKTVKNRSQKALNSVGALNQELLEGVRSLQIARIFGRAVQHATTVGLFARNVTAYIMRIQLLAGGQRMAVDVSTGLAVAAVVISLALLGGTVSDLFGFFAALQLLFPQIRTLVSINFTLQEQSVSCARIFRVLDIEARVCDRADAKELIVSHGTIRFDCVSFRYVSDSGILNDVSMDVPGGSTVAIVGATGAGKSTLLKLLMRFYDVDEGTVSIDGQDVRDVTNSSLMRSMSVVAQDVLLLDRSLGENIRYARPDATDNEVLHAAQSAMLQPFIDAHKTGLSTLIGESGVLLSGGEKQRISLARALLKRAPILLLDEATSSLDTVTELAVTQAIKADSHTRTKIVIAHRLSTIRNADKIVVLHRGRIVEIGTHDELIAKREHYFRMHGGTNDADEPTPAETSERRMLPA